MFAESCIFCKNKLKKKKSNPSFIVHRSGKKQQQTQMNNNNKKHQRVDNTYNLANLRIKPEIETTEPKKIH